MRATRRDRSSPRRHPIHRPGWPTIRTPATDVPMRTVAGQARALTRNPTGGATVVVSPASTSAAAGLRTPRALGGLHARLAPLAHWACLAFLVVAFLLSAARIIAERVSPP